MVTSADPSRVLHEPPTIPGSVIGRAYLWFSGTMFFDTKTLIPSVGLHTREFDGYLWSEKGHSGFATAEEVRLDLSFEDWVLVGVVGEGTDARLTELPTRPGSVIGRSVVKNGFTFFQTAVLVPDVSAETGAVDGYRWAFNGEDSWLSLDEVADLIAEDDWRLVGVVPLGDNKTTRAQQQAKKAWTQRHQEEFRRMTAQESRQQIEHEVREAALREEILIELGMPINL